MTDVATKPADSIGSGTAAPKGLLARAIGVIVSPRETYADIAAHPRVLGALLIVLLLVVSAQTAFLLTEVGRDALFDQQIRTMESFGMRINDQMYEGMERGMEWAPYTGAVFTLLLFPVMFAIVAGIILGVFNAIMGGDASFKQVYAIVVHSGFLMGLQQLFINPLNYARQSMSSPSNLAVFFPFLDETSFAAMLLGGIDLFFIWLIVNQAIGIGVLYKRRTGPIAATMLGIYVSVVLVVAAVRSALSGA
jgi:hypothetical protein